MKGENMQVLGSTESTSLVVRREGRIIKSQPKYLTDNEIYALTALKDSGYVPWAKQTGIECIEMEDLGKSEPVTDIDAFLGHRAPVLQALIDAEIRHGDLTQYSIIVEENRPYLIDFGESRTFSDPRPDKRRGGDCYWLTKTMAALCPWTWHNGRSGEMWNAIDQWVDFAGASVLDVGCGHGDFLIRSLIAGASYIMGIDANCDIVDAVEMKVRRLQSIRAVCSDAIQWLEDHKFVHDVGLCLSVLPYVDMHELLKWLSLRCLTAVIECQYRGDGPGQVADDDEMREILAKYWKTNLKIGSTIVKEGTAERTIWKCGHT